MAAAPILARLYSEFLDPLIRTTYEVMSDNGLLPPLPDAMRGVEYSPEYRSPMATSKKAASAQAFLQAIQTAGPLINTNPAVMMNINADEAFRDIFYMSGVDPSYLRTREEVAKMQKAQSDLAQQQQQAEVANTRASAAQQSAEAVNIAREAGIGV